MRSIIVSIVLAAFIASSIQMPAYAQIDPIPFMPQPGEMVPLSPEFTPAFLKGIVIHPEDPFKFDFIIHRGDQLLSDTQKRQEYTKLTKYFLASLAIPDDDQWVNLSPYEKDRIIKDDFGKTEMGRDLLSQDYMLKQITASLIYPQSSLGQKFWDKVYRQAQAQFGTTNIPVNTFNKVWILPDNAVIYEKGNMAYVLKNHLRVMLEEDYLSLAKHQGQPGDMFPAKRGTCPQAGCQASKLLNVKAPQGNNPHALASKIIKQIVLPELEREVNQDKNFAPLRQVYSGMLLATWFKHELKASILGRIYADQAKVKGVDQDPRTNAQIYERYLKAYKKGVFNFIKEDGDKYTNENIPRKYFSGGAESIKWSAVHLTRNISQGDGAMLGDEGDIDVVDEKFVNAGNQFMQTVHENKSGSDDAMIVIPSTKQVLPYVFSIQEKGMGVHLAIVRKGNFPAIIVNIIKDQFGNIEVTSAHHEVKKTINGAFLIRYRETEVMHDRAKAILIKYQGKTITHFTIGNVIITAHGSGIRPDHDNPEDTEIPLFQGLIRDNGASQDLVITQNGSFNKRITINTVLEDLIEDITPAELHIERQSEDTDYFILEVKDSRDNIEWGISRATTKVESHEDEAIEGVKAALKHLSELATFITNAHTTKFINPNNIVTIEGFLIDSFTATTNFLIRHHEAKEAVGYRNFVTSARNNLIAAIQEYIKNPDLIYKMTKETSLYKRKTPLSEDFLNTWAGMINEYMGLTSKDKANKHSVEGLFDEVVRIKRRQAGEISAAMIATSDVKVNIEEDQGPAFMEAVRKALKGPDFPEFKIGSDFEQVVARAGFDGSSLIVTYDRSDDESLVQFINGDNSITNRFTWDVLSLSELKESQQPDKQEVKLILARLYKVLNIRSKAVKMLEQMPSDEIRLMGDAKALQKGIAVAIGQAGIARPFLKFKSQMEWRSKVDIKDINFDNGYSLMTAEDALGERTGFVFFNESNILFIGPPEVRFTDLKVNNVLSYLRDTLEEYVPTNEASRASPAMLISEDAKVKMSSIFRGLANRAAQDTADERQTLRVVLLGFNSSLWMVNGIFNQNAFDRVVEALKPLMKEDRNLIRKKKRSKIRDLMNVATRIHELPVFLSMVEGGPSIDNVSGSPAVIRHQVADFLGRWDARDPDPKKLHGMTFFAENQNDADTTLERILTSLNLSQSPVVLLSSLRLIDIGSKSTILTERGVPAEVHQYKIIDPVQRIRNLGPLKVAGRMLVRALRGATRDHAQTHSEYGGIDFNSANLNLMIKRDGNGMPLPNTRQDLAQLSRIAGLKPVILDIRPASQSTLFADLQGTT